MTGSVNLGGLLSLSSTGFTATVGDLFFILNNDGTDAITGIFTGLGEGAIVMDNLSNQYRITYLGDFGSNSFIGGNDVA